MMPTKPSPIARHAGPDKRARLVDTAARLVHAQGFDRTTLADIAHASGVPLGNVYYYFKTKEAIGEALVDQLVSAYTCLRETWDALPEPMARLDACIQITMANCESLSRSGCPVGTLCAELHKADGPLARRRPWSFASCCRGSSASSGCSDRAASRAISRYICCQRCKARACSHTPSMTRATSCGSRTVSRPGCIPCPASRDRGRGPRHTPRVPGRFYGIPSHMLVN